MTRREAVGKAIAHELRVAILLEFPPRGGGSLSPNDLAQRVDDRLTNVSYHVRQLAMLDALELAETEPRRGALEHYYRLTPIGVIARKQARRIERALEQLDERFVNGESGDVDGVRRLTRTEAS